MTDILEICARAMASEHYGDNGPDWDDDIPDDEHRSWLSLARACLTALAENVSEEMVEVGKCVELASRIAEVGPNAPIRMPARDVFTAMIQAAIGEKG